MRIVLIFLIFITSILSIFSQTTYINGFVYDFKNDSILKESNVLLKKNGKFGLTDSLGAFSISMKCDCIDTLIIEKEGYCPLMITKVDPSLISSKNELIFYLNRATTSIIIHEVYNKKFLGITFKHIYMSETQKTSTCCTSKDSSYYKGWISYKVEDSIWYNKIRCYHSTTLNEVFRKTHIYNDKHKVICTFNPNEEYVEKTHDDFDSISSCYIIKEKDIDSYRIRGLGQFEIGYTQYIKEKIKELKIKHETIITIQFVLEYNDRYSNFKITGISECDKEKVVKIVIDGPHWPLGRSRVKPLRFEKKILIDMVDTKSKNN
ncbi:MAG: hypothetical protein EHM93_07335 [Bacteroidales bacterium]|nr:MAG: hypothetical protein EHM93_07335 [Bacteroidales bacterium]